MAIIYVGIERVRGKTPATFLFPTCELRSLKLNSYSVLLRHELNAMHLALLLVGINSLAGGLCLVSPDPSTKDMLEQTSPSAFHLPLKHMPFKYGKLFLVI